MILTLSLAFLFIFLHAFRWLGPDADNEAIQLGLTTLRTWWQHRRKGESGSAIAALGTEKMKGVVEGYTRHFFTLAHCLVVNDKEQPPRSLHGRMKEVEKLRSKRTKKRVRDDKVVGGLPVGGEHSVLSSVHESLKNDLTDSNLTPLERLHAAQRRQLATSGMVAQLPGGTSIETPGNQPVINLKGKCIPGKIDLPAVVDAVNHHATQLAHRGVGVPVPVSSNAGAYTTMHVPQQYGDPNTTPVVFVSFKGENQICMKIDGITCAHCVKIVETVLRGCNGNKSPIEGLLDAAADRVLNSVLIKVDHPLNAKRIAFESARNLSMVGYTGTVKEMSIVGADGKSMSIGALANAFQAVASGQSSDDVFDWSRSCNCPDNGIQREDCPR
jgi:copper chaperone CopZ